MIVISPEPNNEIPYILKRLKSKPQTIASNDLKEYLADIEFYIVRIKILKTF